MTPKHTIVSIGYGRHLFTSGDGERERMRACARAAGELHMVIFTLASDGRTTESIDRQLFLYPTNSRTRAFMIFDALRIVRRLVREKRATLITTQDPFETAIVGWIVARLSKTRLVIQEHGDVFRTHHWRQESVMNRVRYAIGWFFLARADMVRVVSKRTKEYFRAHGITRCATLPVAIDTTRFLTAEPDVTVRQLFPANSFVFLSVARFVPQKNITLLLQAFFRAYTNAPHIRLLLVGSGAEEAKLKTLATKLFGDDQRIVVFVPWSDNVPGLMKASDAYVLSSNYEGWGRVLIEALVAKLPVVTTDVGCVGEVIVDGMHGLVVPVGNEARFTEALLKLATDTELQMRIAQVHSQLKLEDVPGTDIAHYGEQWVKTLELS